MKSDATKMTIAQVRYDDADILFISLGDLGAADKVYEANGIVHWFQADRLIGLTIRNLKDHLHPDRISYGFWRGMLWSGAIGLLFPILILLCLAL
jgi:hypothetical protein